MKLKFELVNGYGILVDENNKGDSCDIVYINNDAYKNQIRIKTTAFSNENLNDCKKIIFAEKELKLEGVPVFEWRDFEVEKLAETSYGEKESDANTDVTFALAKGYINGFKEGYKSNPAKYTEEDLQKAFHAGEERILKREYEKGLSELDSYTNLKKSLQKYPKYVVMESEQAGVIISKKFPMSVRENLKYKLFTNSEGKQQGTIKQLIWI